MDDVLDNLAWHSLETVHAKFAVGSGMARRYDPEVAGFVALGERTPEAWSALTDLVGPGEDVTLSGAEAIAPPAGWERLGGGFGYQLVLASLLDDERRGSRADGSDIVQLDDAAVPDMLALVELTKPGPFRPRTIEMGDYFGVFADGQLVAMAGERMQTPGYTEVSAVCTHPSVRGQGLASALTRHVVIGILARGQTPLLHVAEQNVGAKRVYERLGFVVRRRLEFAALRTPARHLERQRP